MNIRLVTTLLSCIAGCYGGLLGAGQGGGSCAAAFRTPAEALQWPNGCPAGNECCTEFGYCHPQSAWLAKAFRDCNGVSNGSPYPIDVIQAETAAAAQGDTRGAALLAAAGVIASQGAAAAASIYGAGYGSGANAGGFGASGNAAGGFGASGLGAYGNTAGGVGASGNAAGGFVASGYGASGYGVSGYGLAGSGAGGIGGAGFVAYSNGAVVPAEPADVAAARSEHLKAHSFV